MKNKFFFTAGMVGMLSGVALGATDGAEMEYGREWSPYVTLRGGWLFGKYKSCGYGEDLFPDVIEKSVKHAWSGSGEMGLPFYEDRVFVGLELGYFHEKATLHEELNNPPRAWGANLLHSVSVKSRIRNFFGACNVTLRSDLNERIFLYGGIGAGIVRISANFKIAMKLEDPGTHNIRESEFQLLGKNWRFLGQAFAGFGVHLNENWQLTAGYRLRWMPKNVPVSLERAEVILMQKLLHAAEVGLTYQF